MGHLAQLVRCAACGSAALQDFLDVLDSLGQLHAYARCQVCSLAQSRVLPSPEELAAFYARYAYESENAWDCSKATAHSLERLGRRLAPYRRYGRLLDIGCGSGILLRSLQRQGWSVEGTELSSVAVERLRAEGFAVHHGSVETLELDKASYDVVVLSETIEHVRDPMRAVAFCESALLRGGVLFLTTPNVDSLSRRILSARWRALCYPDHLFCFNPRSIRVILRSVRLSTVRVWTEGINPFEIFRVARPETAMSRDAVVGRTEALRAATAKSRTGILLKSAVNAVLAALQLGDTLKVLAEKPA